MATPLPLADVKILDLMWAMAGARCDPGAGRLRGYDHPD